MNELKNLIPHETLKQHQYTNDEGLTTLRNFINLFNFFSFVFINC